MKLGKNAVAFILYVIVTVILTYPVTFKINTHIPGGGDAFYWMRTLWYTKTAIFDPKISLTYDSLLFYPEGIPQIAFPSAFNQFLYILLSPIFELNVIYTLLWLLTFIISGFGTYLLVKYLTNNEYAAFLSGIIFAFSPYHMVHALGHLGATTTQWIPFCALYLIKTLKEGGIKNSVLAGIFYGLVVASDLQYMVFVGIFSVLVVFYDLFVELRYRKDLKILSSLLKKYIPFLLVSIAVTLPLTLNEIMIASSQTNFLKPNPKEVIIYSTDLLSFFIPSTLNPFFKGYVYGIYKNFTGNPTECTTYIGYSVLFLSIIGALLNKNKKEVKFWIISAVTFSIISLGPILHVGGHTTFTDFNVTIPLPYLILYYVVPFLENCRTAGRFFVVAALSFSVLAGYGFSALTQRIGNKQFLIILFSTLTIFEYLSIPFPVSEINTYQFYEKIKEDSEFYALMEIPLTHKYSSGVKIIYYQTIHGKPLVGGQAARLPPDAREFEFNIPIIRQLTFIDPSPDIIDINLDNVRGIFKYYRIKYIIIHTNYLSKYEVDLLTELLQKLNFTLEYSEKDIKVYSLPQGDLKHFIILKKNWYPVEFSNQLPFRWISNNATLMIFSPSDSIYLLSMSVISFYKNRTLQVYLNDEIIEDRVIENNRPTKLSFILNLKKGENTVRFYTPDGCQGPVDIPELKNPDKRCLSFAFRDMKIEPLTPWNFLDIGTKDSEPYLIDGWSENEISNNTTYVWANSLSSSVLIVLDEKKQLNLSFKCAPFIFSQNVSQEMDVYFNGNFVGTFILKKDWNVYNVTIPQEFTQIGVNYLDFRYKYAESPKDYGINEDARKLAVAFDWIRIS